MAESNYWDRRLGRRMGRRRLLASGGAVGLAGASALAIGCGDDDDEPSAFQTGTAQTSAIPAKSGGTLRTAVTSFPSSYDPQDVGASGIRTILASRLITAKTGPGVP